MYDDNAFFKLLENAADMYEHHKNVITGEPMMMSDMAFWNLRRSLEITPDRWIIPCIGPSLRTGRGIRELQGLDSENFQKI